MLRQVRCRSGNLVWCCCCISTADVRPAVEVGRTRDTIHARVMYGFDKTPPNPAKCGEMLDVLSAGHRARLAPLGEHTVS